MDSPIKIQSIGGASSSTDGGSNVCGRAGVNRGAPPGRYQEILEGVSGPQANSGFNTSGKTGKSDNQACSGSNGSKTTGDTKTKQSHRDTARPRTKNVVEEYENLFKPGNFVRFYSIISNDGADLTRLNMFKVNKEIKGKIGTFKKLSEDYKNKAWSVEVLSEEQGQKLAKINELVGEPVNVVTHEYDNQSKGVITRTFLKNCTDEDIVEGLHDEGVIGCRRIIKNAKSPDPKPTSTLILTFNTPNPPDRIEIRCGLKERVRLYIPLPRRCFNCHAYNHTGSKCRKIVPICARCGGAVEGDHKPDTCEREFNCVHCRKPHSVTSKTCPEYLLEQEIIAIKTKEHLTFP